MCFRPLPGIFVFNKIFALYENGYVKEPFPSPSGDFCF